MPILGQTTASVIIMVFLFHVIGACKTLPSLIILVSAATKFFQAKIMTYPISTLVVQINYLLNNNILCNKYHHSHHD